LVLPDLEVVARAPTDEVLAELGPGPDGLTTAEARRRLQQHGPNPLRRHGARAFAVVSGTFTITTRVGTLRGNLSGSEFFQFYNETLQITGGTGALRGATGNVGISGTRFAVVTFTTNATWQVTLGR
jgi:hypothetical protein